ncbi:hypothetical protein D3C77_343740 [compost metagenome]
MLSTTPVKTLSLRFCLLLVIQQQVPAKQGNRNGTDSGWRKIKKSAITLYRYSVERHEVMRTPSIYTAGRCDFR